MKTLLISVLIFSTNFVFAESKGTLALRAFVPLSTRTGVNQFNLSGNQSLLILSNQVNSELSQEGQKIEVEGLAQAGLIANLQKVVTQNRSVQYHLLINKLRASSSLSESPIYVKISAN